jgi:amidohydrolase
MLERARKLEKQLIDWRRDFHMHPELGFSETRTAAKVAEVLTPLGYRVRTGVGRTGVVADRGEGKPIVGVRADMDALPIQETNDVPYASQVPGVMHACGHDAHTAMGLGVATLFSQETFPGTIRFLFQPAEEVADEEGVSGAPRMVEDGALEAVDAVIALHVDATHPTGSVKLGAGSASAGVDTFYTTILGQGGHGAYPHEVVDPIYISSHVIQALNGIVSRRLNPTEAAVVSIGSIHGGTTDNVIPDRVEMKGTIRYMSSEVQNLLHSEIQTALEIARTMHGDYELKIEIGYPPLLNDAGVVEVLKGVSTDLLGAEHVQTPEPQMGAEDFSFFCSKVPGAMFLLGCRIEGDERRAHSSAFDIDERCLPIGVAILAETALRLIKGKISY